MAKKVVVARLEILKGQENEFMLLIPELVKSSRAEAGCLSYTLYQNPDNPSEFIFYEEYTDDGAFKLHGDSAHFRFFAGNVGRFLAKDLDIQIF